MNLSRARDNDATLVDLTYYERIEASTLPELRIWRDTLGLLFKDAEDHCQHTLATELVKRDDRIRREIAKRHGANALAKVRRLATMQAWT